MQGTRRNGRDSHSCSVQKEWRRWPFMQGTRRNSCIEIQLPRDAAFDTYALKNASDEEIRQVEQG